MKTKCVKREKRKTHKPNYRVKERWNIYEGKMYEVQVRMFRILWASAFTGWYKSKKRADKIVFKLNNHQAIH